MNKCFIQLDDVLRNGEILPYQVYRGCLRMDGQTMVNLEIFRNNDDGGPSGRCLFQIQGLKDGINIFY